MSIIAWAIVLFATVYADIYLPNKSKEDKCGINTTFIISLIFINIFSFKEIFK